MAGKQNWLVKLDTDTDTVLFLTRADKMVRQRFALRELPTAIREKLALRGLKVTLEERTSEIPGAALTAKMEGRQEVYDLWLTGAWEKERQGGPGFTVKIEYEAIAALLDCSVSDAVKAVRSKPEEEREKFLKSEKVQAKVREMQADREESDATPNLDDLL